MAVSVEHEPFRTGRGILNEGFAALFRSRPQLRLFWTAEGEAGNVHDRLSANAGLNAGYFSDASEESSTVTDELFMTVRLGGNAAFRNSLLQGRLLNNVQNSMRLQRYGTQLEYGLSARYRRFKLYYGQVVQTQDQSNLQPGMEKWHHFGSFEGTMHW